MTGWSVSRLPNFVAEDSAEMTARLLAKQVEFMRQGVSDPVRYADVYARVFEDRDLAAWVALPPARVAEGLTTIVRQVGLFVLQDDAVALSALFDEAFWEPLLPPVRIARRTPEGGPIYTATRAHQQNNRVVLQALVHRAAALAFAERLPSVAIDNLPTTLRLRETVTTMFDAAINEASTINDGTVRTLRLVQAATWTLIDRRAPAREVGSLELAGAMPSLVCAHFAYREARQAPRIRRANPTAHPNFMPPSLIVPPWP